MIGVVVVTHGQLATELVNAAEMIVGDLPQFTAVSIGWHDDVNDAREDIAQAIERVRGEEGVLLLTDMFGGTPSNLGMTFLETDRLEVITGVNLPMLIKLASLRRSSDLLAVGEGDARPRPQRDLGGVGPAARRKEHRMTSQTVTVVNQLGMHARAAAKFVHLATRYESRVTVARDAREMDGKSIMGILLLAAARGSTITISRRGHGTSATPSTRWWRWCSPASARTHAAPEGHRRLAGRRRPAAPCMLIQRAQVLRYQIAATRDRPRGRAARREPRSSRAISWSTSRRAWRCGARSSASLFDAQLLMLDDPMLLPRAADIVREQRVNAEWAVQQVFHEFSAVVRRGRRSLPARAQGRRRRSGRRACA